MGTRECRSTPPCDLASDSITRAGTAARMRAVRWAHDWLARGGEARRSDQRAVGSDVGQASLKACSSSMQQQQQQHYYSGHQGTREGSLILCAAVPGWVWAAGSTSLAAAAPQLWHSHESLSTRRSVPV